MGQHRSDDLKQAVVNFYQRMPNKSIDKTSNVFQIPAETTRRWINRFEETGSIHNTYRNSISYKVTQEHFNYIKLLVTKQKDIYLLELHQKLVEEYPNLDISARHLSRVVKDIPYSKKLFGLGGYSRKRTATNIQINSYLLNDKYDPNFCRDVTICPYLGHIFGGINTHLKCLSL